VAADPRRAVPWIAVTLLVTGLVAGAALLAGPARRQLSFVEESLAVQRRLLATAEQLLAQVREINRKTPGSPVPVGR
jgi:hypothetical protein